ncbi:DUF3793 family protein [Clostridium lundense]|uniref:DUF3793 family protein n=1 Tax=Clostridium lundense TaxID=319475 RepID=UPI00048635A5|nr:DUF3793 family protein [Clostridium lundense]
MTQFEIISILKMINSLGDREYMFYMTAYNIAPTIEGTKPSSILTFSKNNRNLYESWIKYKEQFIKYFNVEAFQIKDTGDTHTILFYRQNELYNQIFKKENINFLKRFGYKEDMQLEECLQLLKKRYENFCPHEIGIFLGIPLEDVKAFMNCSNKPCLTCGYWKVYSNLDKALDTFKCYDEAKMNILKSVKDQLILNNNDTNVKA